MGARAPEIEDLTNLWIVHPLSNRVARLLSKTPVHPNAVSIAGMLCGFAAAWFFYNFDQGNSVYWALAFMFAWHVLDGADGHLARLTGKATVFGRVMDGFADYSVYLSVYVALGLAIAERYNGPVVWLVVAGAVSHIVQAAAYERQRESYTFWVYSGQAGKEPGKTSLPDFLPFRLLLAGYLKMQNAMDSATKMKQQGFDLALGPHRRELAAAEFKRKNENHMHVWSILSANAHTFALFLFAWLGNPITYFLFEIIALNGVLILLLIIKNQKDAEFSHFLKELQPANLAKK